MPDDGYLGVYRIDQNGNRARNLRCVLGLPSICPKSLHYSVHLRANTVIGKGPQDARYPFYMSRQQALIAVSMDVPCSTETMRLTKIIIIFIPVTTIRSILNRADAYPDVALDLAWDEWGVVGTRVVHGPSKGRIWKCSVHGTRAIVSYQDQTTLSLDTYEISQGLVLHDRQDTVTPAGWHDAALVTIDDLEGACDDDRHGLPANGLPPRFEMETARVRVSCITEPTTLTSSGMPPKILLDTVTSTLPYRLSEWRLHEGNHEARNCHGRGCDLD